mmetsp:Transcript_60073/g.130285  ORF Transcript_60073/g.130285 Transcript_60073/m.130285 type:complete len:372 (-) Transcript_60073:27-1142(-)
MRVWGLLGYFFLARGTTFEPWSPCPDLRGDGRRVLITGVTGMLGSHVAEALLLRGYEVWGVVRPRSNMRNIAPFSARLRVVTAELTDPWRTLKIVEEVAPDYIYHFAAQAFNSLSFEEPQSTLNTNIMATLNLLEALRRVGTQKTKFLLAGSSTVYGMSTEDWDGPIPETAALQPVSPYGVSKAAAEMLVLQYARSHGLYALVLRFFIHLGPRGVEALALHEFARQIALIERGFQEPVIKHGDISTRRDITEIVDSAPVVICLAEIAPSGTVVNVGSNVSYTMSELLEKAVSLSKSKERIRLELDPARLRVYDERLVMADISRLQNLTGWRPSPDMPSLIGQLLDYWRREVAFRRPVDEAQRASGGSSSEL